MNGGHTGMDWYIDWSQIDHTDSLITLMLRWLVLMTIVLWMPSFLIGHMVYIDALMVKQIPGYGGVTGELLMSIYNSVIVSWNQTVCMGSFRDCSIQDVVIELSIPPTKPLDLVCG